MKLTVAITLTLVKAGTMYILAPIALTSGTEGHSEPCQMCKIKLFAKIFYVRLSTVNYFRKKLHVRYLTWFCI